MTATAQPWYAHLTLDTGTYDPDRLTTRWLARAQAHLIAADTAPTDRAREHLHAGFDAFAAAALARGHTPEWAWTAAATGHAGVHVYQWLLEAGIQPETIAAAHEGGPA